MSIRAVVMANGIISLNSAVIFIIYYNILTSHRYNKDYFHFYFLLLVNLRKASYIAVRKDKI